MILRNGYPVAEDLETTLSCLDFLLEIEDSTQRYVKFKGIMIA